VFSRHQRKTKLLLCLAEVLLIAVAFEAAYQTRTRITDLRFIFYLTVPVKALLLGWAMAVWAALGYWLGIYDRAEHASIPAVLRDTIRQAAIAGVAIVLFEYSLRLDLSRLFLGFFLVYGGILVVAFRLNGRRIARFLRHEPARVLVVGRSENALRVGRQLEESGDYGVELLGFLDDEAGAPVRLEREYPVHELRALPGLLREHVVDEIIFAVDSRRLAALEDLFLLCDEEGVRTHVAVDIFPHVNSEVYLERLGARPLLTFSATPHDELRLLLKRVLDVVIAGSALAVLSPLLLLAMLVVRLTSPGPAIFRQTRCGLNGRRFTVYKLRSMRQDAERLKDAVAHLNERDQVVFKIRNDPRLTPVGKWLRKFSIDEWPQLWNVLKGDMSLVGPRPAVPGEVEQYQRWQRRRLRMRPGLTCLWAVSGRDELDFETWMKLDMQYIDNWSLALDWKILLQTIPQVLGGRGAH
jgi:exopolysaccharide biosynthesis polyprenyl glycosylphosphotransferase